MIAPELRILIVDDEKINLKILSDLLKSHALITLANNGPDAVTKAQQLKPDIILLDVVMPGMNGFDVISELKQSAATSEIPVIFITGLDDAGNEEKGFELGACDYIQKPFHAAVVKARVKLHLQLARQRMVLEDLANIDPLTAIANRRKYEETFEREWRACRRDGADLIVAMADIDFFKAYNDHYGHAAGDSVLSDVAQTLRAQMTRPRDFIARYGGEEFVIISVGTGMAGVRNILQRCVEAVYDLDRLHSESSHQRVTISIGGVSCVPGADDTQSELLRQADQMLYRAKQAGRNCLQWQNLNEPASSPSGSSPANLADSIPGV